MFIIKVNRISKFAAKDNRKSKKLSSRTIIDLQLIIHTENYQCRRVTFALTLQSKLVATSLLKLVQTVKL